MIKGRKTALPLIARKLGVLPLRTVKIGWLAAGRLFAGIARKRGPREAGTLKVKAPMKLSMLRDIGWKEWDPIGLLADGRAWDNQPFADEYDNYLLQVASNLRRGGTIENAINDLLTFERHHMGLGVQDGQETRAEATARSIYRYVIELDDERTL